MQFKYLQKDRKETTSMHYASMTTNAWNNLLENPRVIPDKSLAPLAIWGVMTPHPQLNDYGDPRCIGANVSHMYALQIDVDNGCSIESFVKDYHRYRFTLYTSCGYGHKQGDRYRVIFPLSEPLVTEHLVPTVKEYLVDLFPMSDDTCFDKGHFQIMPTILTKDSPYRYLRHDGERLSFAYANFGKMASEYSESSHWRREIAEADRDPNSNHEGALRKAQELLDNAEEGSRNKTMWSVLGWLVDKVNVTPNELYILKPPFGMEVEWENMIRRKT